MSGATKSLSPARLGEAWAHLAFFSKAPRDVVLTKLGHSAATFDADAARVRDELARDLERGRLGAVLAMSRAFDRVDRRLRSRRPTVDAIERDATLEPSPGERHASPPEAVVPLAPGAEKQPLPQNVALPSYLKGDANAMMSAPSASLPSSSSASSGPIEPPAPIGPPAAGQASPIQSGAAADAARPPAHLTTTSPNAAKKPGTLPFVPLAPGEAPAPPRPIPLPEERVGTGTEIVEEDGPSLEGELEPFSSLVRYAELVASLRGHPDKVEETLHAAGLVSAEDRGKVHGHWFARFERDPATKQRFDRLCEALQRNRNPPTG